MTIDGQASLQSKTVDESINDSSDEKLSEPDVDSPDEKNTEGDSDWVLPNGKPYVKECRYDSNGRDMQWPHWTHGMKRFATEGGIWLFSTIVWAFMLVYGVQASFGYDSHRCENLGPLAACSPLLTFHAGQAVIALTAIIVMELLIAAGCAGSRLWNPAHEDKWFTTAAWWDVSWSLALAASAAAMLVIIVVVA